MPEPSPEAFYLGIDLGGTNIQSAVVSGDKRLLAKDARLTPASEGPECVMDAMLEAAQATVQKAGLSFADVAAAGIGAPGPMNWRTGVVYSPPNLAGWKDVPLAGGMGERLGLPCYVDNDANVATYGEFWLGAGQGVETMCLLTLGTGLGGGIVSDGKLMRGIDGTAGEIGHMAVAPDGRLCGCGARGCLEAYGSVTGMVQTAREGIEKGETSSLSERCGGNLKSLTGRMISEEANGGDPFSQSVIRQTGAWIGMGVASLINLLNPEKVVLYGGMTGAGDLLLEAIRETAMQRAFEVPARRAEILFGALGGDAGVLGAAGCAVERHVGQGS